MAWVVKAVKVGPCFLLPSVAAACILVSEGHRRAGPSHCERHCRAVRCGLSSTYALVQLSKHTDCSPEDGSVVAEFVCW